MEGKKNARRKEQITIWGQNRKREKKNDLGDMGTTIFTLGDKKDGLSMAF